MTVDLPSEFRTRVHVTNEPSGETCPRLSWYFARSRLSVARKGRDPSRSADHSEASAGTSFTNGPFTFWKNSRLLEIHVGTPMPTHGSLHPTASRWSCLPLGFTRRTSKPFSSPAS